MEHYTTYTRQAQHSIKYRFKCEHCGKDSGWQTVKCTGMGYGVIYQYNRNKPSCTQFEAEEAAKKNAVKNLNIALKDFQKQTIRGYYSGVSNEKNNILYGKVEELKCRCSYCKKLQTWGMGGVAASILFGIIAGIIFLILSFIVHNKLFSIPCPWLMFPEIFIGSCLLVTLLCIIIYNLKTKNVTRKEKPEIDWNGWFEIDWNEFWAIHSAN